MLSLNPLPWRSSSKCHPRHFFRFTLGTLLNDRGRPFGRLLSFLAARARLIHTYHKFTQKNMFFWLFTRVPNANTTQQANFWVISTDKSVFSLFANKTNFLTRFPANFLYMSKKAVPLQRIFVKKSVTMRTIFIRKSATIYKLFLATRARLLHVQCHR